MDIKELYQEIVLDHGKNPRNKNKCAGFNKDAKGHNPLCGDKVHVYLKLDKNKNKFHKSMFSTSIKQINGVVLLKKFLFRSL